MDHAHPQRTALKPSVLYVEDNAGDAVLLREALRERGHAVELLIIERGDQALHYFEIKASARDLPPPHCILLDTHLPVVTGIELIAYLRSVRCFDATPVYIFASEEEYAALRGRVPIANHSFLNKPHDWDHFLMLADLLMRSATTDQTRPPGGGPELPAQDELGSHPDPGQA